MSTVTLTAQPRTDTGKGAARSLRRGGRIPAVLYGSDLENALHLSVDTGETQRLFNSVSVENTIIEIKVEGGDESYRTLVREVQTHPWKGSLLHVDFLWIRRGVTVDLTVPVHLTGSAAGVGMGGIVEQVLHDLPIRCIPSKIPEMIEVDITRLDIGDSVTVGDLDLGEGVEASIEPDRTVCTLTPPTVVGTEEEEEEEEEEVGDVIDGAV
ncbi:MAG: 50S ribosomal protein L25/general stress protein Ctc [Gemmatimonadetes bacterium]|nr:50S ribosomal protein L25/general stress protein Ctc [Gemmatimonadota bacterium]